MASTPSTLGRRTLLRMGACGIVGSTLSACTRLARSSGAAPGGSASVPLDSSLSNGSADAEMRRVLLVFFSRAGENYFNGGRKHLTIGNTEVAANMIRSVVDCDVYKIQPSEPYSDSYDDTVRAVSGLGNIVEEYTASCRGAHFNSNFNEGDQPWRTEICVSRDVVSF